MSNMAITTPEGKSVHKAFLFSIAFRASVRFFHSRFHPILNNGARTGRFAAPTGTGVKATADGVITLVDSQSSYGNVVTINHQDRYTTVYGHLSLRQACRGQRVAQGDVIGCRFDRPVQDPICTMNSG